MCEKKQIKAASNDNYLLLPSDEKERVFDLSGFYQYAPTLLNTRLKLHPTESMKINASAVGRTLPEYFHHIDIVGDLIAAIVYLIRFLGKDCVPDFFTWIISVDLRSRYQTNEIDAIYAKSQSYLHGLSSNTFHILLSPPIDTSQPPPSLPTDQYTHNTSFLLPKHTTKPLPSLPTNQHTHNTSFLLPKHTTKPLPSLPTDQHTYNTSFLLPKHTAKPPPSLPTYKPTHDASLFLPVPPTNNSNNSKEFLEQYQITFENGRLIPADTSQWQLDVESGLKFLYNTGTGPHKACIGGPMVILQSEHRRFIGISSSTQDPITLNVLALKSVCYGLSKFLQGINTQELARDRQELARMICAIDRSIKSQSKRHRFFSPDLELLNQALLIGCNATVTYGYHKRIEGELMGLWPWRNDLIYPEMRVGEVSRRAGFELSDIGTGWRIEEKLGGSVGF